MIISVRIGVTLTSTPEYPSSASSLVKTSLSSAKKTPSATNCITTKTKMIYKLSGRKKSCSVSARHKTKKSEEEKVKDFSLLAYLGCHSVRLTMAIEGYLQRRRC